MGTESPLSLGNAIQDFREARQKASLRDLMARLTGENAELLSFDEVRLKLKAQVGARRTTQEIPLASIIGSVNRYEDFRRDFLPRDAVDASRWARVEMATYGMEGLPPIEVYQIGEAYFVSDGNHRVSVARRLGATHIQAYVTEVQSRVPLTPDVRAEDLILKAEYAVFLERSRLDEQRPQVDLSVTAPGQYAALETHIAVHRYFMGQEQQREIPYPVAASHWYETVYTPVVEIIRQRDLLHDFPGRTETDLYLWLAEHRAALEEELGRPVAPELAASDLAAQFSPRPQRVAARLGAKMLETLVPASLEGGPQPGQWRTEKLSARRVDRLFSDILVPVNGQEDGWFALEQAILIAQRESGRLHGLFVAPDEAQAQSPSTLEIQSEFARRCQAAGLESQDGKENRLVIAVGEVTRRICENARWSDLVVVNLTYPPGPGPLATLESGFHALVQRCPSPILVAPQCAGTLSRALLAYDGSPKAQEALFVAAYLAGQWQIPLQIVSVVESGRVAQDTLAAARRYLENHALPASYTLVEGGDIAASLLQAADSFDADLLLLGGYGRSVFIQAVLGNTVDQVLRQARRPMLICR